MKRLLGSIVLCAALVVPAAAQTSGTDTSNLLNAPNNTSEQTPGTWTQNARTRHRGFIDARVNAPRAGLRGGVIITESGSAAAGGGGSSGLGQLEDLLNLFGGGSLDDLVGGDLGGLVEGLTGSEIGTSTTDTTTTDTTTTDTTTGTGGTSLADLIRQRATEGGATAQNKTGTMQTSDDSSSDNPRRNSGAIARLPKPEERFQTSTDGTETTDDRKFVVRWADSLLASFFNAATVALRTAQFGDLLEVAFRPLFSGQAISASNTDTGSNEDSNSDSDNNANDDSGTDDSNNNSGDGGGVEDLPDDNANDNSNSGGTV